MHARSLSMVVAAVLGCGGAAESTPAPDAGTSDVAATFPDAPRVEDSATDAAAMCADNPLVPARAEWLLVVDHSASFTTRSDRFAGMKDGAKLFLDERGDSITLGMSAFPRLDAGTTKCAPAEYLALDLAWGTPRPTVVSDMQALTLAGEGGLGPALAGAGTAARARQALHRDRSVSIVLLSDATPSETEACTSAWPELTTLASKAFGDGTGDAVHVYAVSVVGRAVAPDHAGRWGELVAAGGGYVATVNGGQADVAKSTSNALRDMHDRESTCTFVVPPGVKPSELDLSFPDGTVQKATRFANAKLCTGAGFYLDDENDPRHATLCSGEAGIGGFCEVSLMRARMFGAPTVRAICGSAQGL